jgi:hypothetical protein
MGPPIAAKGHVETNALAAFGQGGRHVFADAEY